MTNPQVSDGIGELVEDHRLIEQYFTEWQRDTTLAGEERLARRICEAIERHLKLDEELFYPAYGAATQDEFRSRNELQDHVQLLELLKEIKYTGATEEAFFAKVYLLCELFSQHVNREEEDAGIFERARQSSMDLSGLAASLRRRRQQFEQHPGGT